MYYNIKNKGFYVEIEPDAKPEDLVLISDEQWLSLILDESNGASIVFEGGEVVSKPCLAVVDSIETTQERVWRDSELIKSDSEINKLQDSDPKSYGTIAEWRSYRKALRGWTEHSNFPNPLHRPTPPKN